MAMNPALTNVLDPNKLNYSIGEMLYEWLTRSDAFGSGATGSATITRVPAEFKQGNLQVPGIFFERVDDNVLTVGAGMRKSVTQDLNTFRITVRADRGESDGFLKLDRTGDKLMAYFKDNEKGRSVLGKSGLRRAELVGPFPAHTERYWEYNYLLRFKTVI